MLTDNHLDHGTEHVPATSWTGRAVAWLGFATGCGASVIANMLHADLTGAGVAELVGAAFWPIALLLALEVLTRIAWPVGKLWSLARFGGVGLVAIVAAVLSYRHMAGLLAAWGEDALNAHLGPLAVDGLMLVSATALLALSRTKVRQPGERASSPADTGSVVVQDQAAVPALGPGAGTETVPGVPTPVEAVEVGVEHANGNSARPHDVERLRAAIRSRELDDNPSLNRVRQVLGLSHRHAKAALAAALAHPLTSVNTGNGTGSPGEEA